jgi:hypothetical protein
LLAYWNSMSWKADFQSTAPVMHPVVLAYVLPLCSARLNVLSLCSTPYASVHYAPLGFHCPLGYPVRWLLGRLTGI